MNADASVKDLVKMMKQLDWKVPTGSEKGELIKLYLEEKGKVRQTLLLDAFSPAAHNMIHSRRACLCRCKGLEVL